MTVAERLLAGRYRLEDKVAVGGMGVVWRATDEMLGRRVAVKLLHEALTGDAIAAERFRREAHAAASLSHPNMANVFDFVEENGEAAIVMELVEGETLAERMVREGAMPIDASARIAAAVLDALGAAHEVGIVHRDVKPANILLTNDGGVKLTDLGIAHVPGQAGLTQTGTLMATPHYVAPEMLRAEPATPAADLFAMGAVLYEMLTGKKPFDGETPLAVAMSRLSVEPTPPTRVRPGIPAALEQVVVRAMAPDPAARYPDAASMRDALEAAAAAPTATMLLEPGADYTVPISLPDGPVPVEERAPRSALLPVFARNRKLTVLAALVFAIALLASFAIAASGPSTIEVPELTGRSVAEARATLTDLGLRLQVTREPGVLPADEVLEQRPAAGTVADEGDAVTVVVSDGSKRLVPTLVGETLSAARGRIERFDLTMGTVRTAETNGVTAGTVIGQDPPRGTEVDAGATVDLVVAREPAPSDEGKDGDDEGKGNRKRRGGDEND